MGSAQSKGATARGNIGKRYILLPGQRGVLAQTYGICEPSHTYTSLCPWNYETPMLPCFFAFYTSRSSLPTHHPGRLRALTVIRDIAAVTIPRQGERHQHQKPPAVEHLNPALGIIPWGSCISFQRCLSWISFVIPFLSSCAFFNILVSRLGKWVPQCAYVLPEQEQRKDMTIDPSPLIILTPKKKSNG